jgi:hypothetical protein
MWEIPEIDSDSPQKMAQGSPVINSIVYMWIYGILVGDW